MVEMMVIAIASGGLRVVEVMGMALRLVISSITLVVLTVLCVLGQVVLLNWRNQLLESFTRLLLSFLEVDVGAGMSFD